MVDIAPPIAVRYRNKILKATARSYVSAVCPGFFLVHDNAWPHVARASRQFLDAEGTDAIDWPLHSPDMNLIENLWDIMYQSIQGCQLATHTVQELTDALIYVWAGIPQDIIQADRDPTHH